MIAVADLLPTDVGSVVRMPRFGIDGRLDALGVPVYGMVPVTVDGVGLLVDGDELLVIDRGDSPDSPSVRAAEFNAAAHRLLANLARKAHA